MSLLIVMPILNVPLFSIKINTCLTYTLLLESRLLLMVSNQSRVVNIALTQKKKSITPIDATAKSLDEWRI